MIYTKDKLNKMSHRQKWLKILLKYRGNAELERLNKHPNYVDEANILMDLVLGEVKPESSGDTGDKQK